MRFGFWKFWVGLLFSCWNGWSLGFVIIEEMAVVFKVCKNL